MLLTWILCLWASLAAQEEVIQETTAQTAQDSLEALLTEPILDSLIVGYADSLFLPSVGDARIFRDLYGIPHIYGETDRDCAFGFGYAHSGPSRENLRCAIYKGAVFFSTESDADGVTCYRSKAYIFLDTIMIRLKTF